MTVFRLLGSFALVAWMSAGSAAEVALRIIPPSATIVDQALHYRVLLLVRSDSEKPERITPRATAENAKVLSVVPTSAEISKTKSAVFTVNLAAEGLPKPDALHLTIQEKPQYSASCPLLPVLDLTAVEWQEWWQGERSSLDSLQGVPSPNTPWKTSSLPREWQQLGVTWLRTRLTIPQAWRSLKLQLELAAVDDRDVTFLNGRKIGRTDGWDKPRVYPIPADQVRWGEANELCIAAENGFAGGGLYRTPIQLRIGDFGQNARRDSLFSQSVGQEESKRTPPGPIGRPAPLRPVHVRDGVLRYPDGAEVAIWGVNYYPQSCPGGSTGCPTRRSV